MEQQKAFKDLPVGAQFFDPDSGEDFMKVSTTSGRMLTGGDALAGKTDTFEPDTMVEPADAQSIIRDLLGAVGEMRTQVDQMKGMFKDDDNAIQNALEDADAAEERARAFIKLLENAPADATTVTSPAAYVRRALVVVSSGGAHAFVAHDNLNCHVVTINDGVKPSIPRSHVDLAIKGGYQPGEFDITAGVNSDRPHVLVTLRDGVAYVIADAGIETMILDYDDHPAPEPVIPEAFRHLAERAGCADYMADAAPVDSDTPGM